MSTSVSFESLNKIFVVMENLKVQYYFLLFQNLFVLVFMALDILE